MNPTGYTVEASTINTAAAVTNNSATYLDYARRRQASLAAGIATQQAAISNGSLVQHNGVCYNQYAAKQLGLI